MNVRAALVLFLLAACGPSAAPAALPASPSVELREEQAAPAFRSGPVRVTWRPVPGDERRSAELRSRARDDAVVARHVHERWHALFGEAMRLERREITIDSGPEPAPSERRDDHGHEHEVPQDAPARRQTGWRSDGGWIQRSDDVSAAERAALALIDVHRSHGPLARVPVPDWFATGFTAFLGGVEVREEDAADLPRAQWRDERIRLDLVALVRGDYQLLLSPTRADRPRDLALRWTIDAITSVAEPRDVLRTAQQVDPDSYVLTQQYFAARAWGLVHFLWHYDGGKYRERLRACLGAALRGELTKETFEKIAGGEGGRDAASLGLEFDWYWNQLLRRDVRGAALLRRETDDARRKMRDYPPPTTEAPVGRWEPEPPSGEPVEESGEEK